MGMTREEAIKRLEDTFEGWNMWVMDNDSPASKMSKALEMAISALREQEHKSYNTHEVACIIAELFGDDCACNHNCIDEWLPEKCELLDACPNPVGVACWEQYLKYRECGRRLEEV